MKIEASSLPRLMLVTQRAMMQPFAQVLEAALQDGARLIQLREKDISELDSAGFAEFIDMAVLAREVCGRFGATLITNCMPEAAYVTDSHGVQISSCLLPAQENAIEAWHFMDLMCGVSVHSLAQAQRAQELGVDYLVLGSIFPTDSHPQGSPLGLQVLAEVARAVKIPVFAIGGINSKNALLCLEAGAHGVAVIRAAWNPDERRELLRVVGEG